MGEIKRSWFILYLFAAFACNEKAADNREKDDLYEGLEFEMPIIKEPVIPDLSVSITDFGAVSDGYTLNTQAFADAIQYVTDKGGGKIVIPRGIWLTGPIILKNNLNIHAEAGALVVFSKDKNLYPLIETSFEGLNTVRCLSPIYGKNLENIAFTGEGVFDGSGEAWRFVKRSKLTESQWKDLVASGGIVDEKGNNWYPSESFKKGAEISDMNVPRQFSKKEEYEPIKDFLRPVMVSLVSCKNVLFDGPVFQNSPAWCIHPLMCENLIIRNIDVRNPWFSQNGDGIDIESCKNSVVYNCTFDVGDDAICIKSGKDKDGRDRAMPTENLIIKNCIVYHGHGGVTVGSEMSGGVKNMHVSDCTFIGTDVGLRFKSNRGRGGVVEGIYISDVNMMNIPTNAISFDLYYGGLSVSEMLASDQEMNIQVDTIPEVSEETPQFKDIIIRNVTCKGALQGIYLQGLPEMNLENIVLENINMEADNGLFCMDVNGVTIRNLFLRTKKLPAFDFYNSKNISIKELVLPESEQPVISVNGERTENVTIEVISDKEPDKYLILGEKVNAEMVHVKKH
ncbi:MAG: glycoside hydrolase [Bacteroidetes bacterium GWF2_42_66]|nr:MAG: glycoside hydrolase [Bacteroidetes bacterium GWA2_42_15]OFY02613.1 MAG: glycoside hydrolase [Bacteroidetes bacterium GWE2_42_39]OFY41287.1 MAG: glycoside hydrolase [Bacteroidetes bacterium GWF2_42_66]HBL75521.1 glycoside hydrolase [Prolixibacteraceae bacterium]HCU60570.1 glycoside hydrolase [Prolixibacteraceae bacterium]